MKIPCRSCLCTILCRDAQVPAPSVAVRGGGDRRQLPGTPLSPDSSSTSGTFSLTPELTQLLLLNTQPDKL